MHSFLRAASLPNAVMRGSTFDERTLRATAIGNEAKGLRRQEIVKEIEIAMLMPGEQSRQFADRVRLNRGTVESRGAPTTSLFLGGVIAASSCVLQLEGREMDGCTCIRLPKLSKVSQHRVVARAIYGS